MTEIARCSEPRSMRACKNAKRTNSTSKKESLQAKREKVDSY